MRIRIPYWLMKLLFSKTLKSLEDRVDITDVANTTAERNFGIFKIQRTYVAEKERPNK